MNQANEAEINLTVIVCTTSEHIILPTLQRTMLLYTK